MLWVIVVMCCTAEVDYALSTAKKFNVIISAGSTSSSFRINITDDKIQEINETFSINITLLSSCLPLVLGTSSSTVTIIDNDGTNNSSYVPKGSPTTGKSSYYS